METMQQLTNVASSKIDSVRYASVRRRVIALGILVLVAFAVSSCIGLWRAHRQSVGATDRELGNLARALSEQTAWTSEAFDLLLKDTATWYAADGRHQANDRVDAVLADRAAGVRQVRKLTITDANGLQRYRSDGRVSPDLDISSRSYFAALRDEASSGRSGLFITQPLSHDGMRNVVLFARRIEDDQRKFLGVVTATVDLQDLKDLYGAVQLGPGNAIQLLRSDGTLLVRNPAAQQLVGEKFLQITAPAKASPLRLTSPIDGNLEFAAIAPVRDAPLVLTVTRQESVALSSWRDEAGGAIASSAGSKPASARFARATRDRPNR